MTLGNALISLFLKGCSENLGFFYYERSAQYNVLKSVVFQFIDLIIESEVKKRVAPLHFIIFAI